MKQAVARDPLGYQVCPVSPEAHLFEVRLRIPAPLTAPLRLAMPAWIPGSYMVRDFARNLIAIAATDASGKPLELIKLDKQTWELPSAGSGPVEVTWRVFALEQSVRAAHLDRSHAYFNGPSLFLRLVGHEARPCDVELLPPPGEDFEHWRVATSLAPAGAEPLGFGRYRAEDYGDLIDHPVEMGPFTLVPFTVQGVDHAMAISGRHRANEERLARDLERICATHAALFGELPVDRYLFLTWTTGDGYGGLEHRFSTSLICARDDLACGAEDTPSEGYRRFLGLCSHEYFHLWNVKRIRPRVFQEGGLEREVHTRLLWAFEGITSYYDDLGLVRSGCIDAPAYLQCLAETITRVMRTPGRFVQTLAESSFDAWTKFYKQDANAPNAIVSYYAKGALTALALDLLIRRDTNGDMSLDDLMRALWARHGRTGIGVEERGIEALAREITGLYLDDFFAEALDSTRDLELQSLFSGVGVMMRLRPQSGPKDMGGCVERFDAVAADPTLAVRLVPGRAEAVIQNVIAEGAGERAGLCPGDQIVAVDGLKASADNLAALVKAAASGVDEGALPGVRLHLFRGDELQELVAHPQPAIADTCELMLVDPVSERLARARESWLSGPR